MNRSLLLLPLILLAMILSVWSGWLRIGWSLPLSATAAQHGTFMVNSFLASLIFLERAVTFRNRLVLLLPLVQVSGVIAILAGVPQAAPYLHIAGAIGFILMCLYFIYRHRELYYYVFLAGALCLLTGNLVLLKTGFYPAAVTWWMGFLLCTIVGERVELTRFLALTKRKKAGLIFAIGCVLVALCWPFHLNGHWLLALSFSATAIWLLRYDMAWQSIRIKGQHRYSGLLLITGYIWLLLSAALLPVAGRFAFGYDAFVHAFFIGFVFSMIFSHAPIILPAVARLPFKIFRPVLYVWFVLLQLSLAVRIAGDLLTEPAIRKAGGMANGFVILLFFGTIGMIVRRELQKRAASAVKA